MMPNRAARVRKDVIGIVPTHYASGSAAMVCP